MGIAINLKKYVINFLSIIKKIYDDTLNVTEDAPYRIIEIDSKLHQVTIHCCGTQARIQTTFEEIINDSAILNGLLPLEACLVGYYHGKALREGKLSQSNAKKKQSISLLLRPSEKRYNIIALEHRHFKITYIEHQSRTEYSKSVIDLAQNNEFLKNISPSQACYIGIWAGIAVAKHGPDILIPKPSKSPFLRVIK